MTIVFKFETIYHSYVGTIEKLWNISDDKERILECEKVYICYSAYYNYNNRHGHSYWT